MSICWVTAVDLRRRFNIPVNTRRLRRRPNIVPTLGKCFVFAGMVLPCWWHITITTNLTHHCPNTGLTSENSDTTSICVSSCWWPPQQVRKLARRPRWLIRSACGSKLIGTKLESGPGRIFVIAVVHLQCSKLFKCLEVYGRPTVHHEESLKSFDKSRASASFCRDIAMIVQKAT